ncbi:hypothetical protein [Methylobacterium sp. 1030]|uniref:hypothetical protein n=1 Tax=Methylobacterium sp. 1030 TaxID=3156404 RepID=UPI0033944771
MPTHDLLDVLVPHRVSVCLRWQLAAYLWCCEHAHGPYVIVEGGVTDTATWIQLRDDAEVVFGFSDQNDAFAFKMRWG